MVIQDGTSRMLDFDNIEESIPRGHPAHINRELRRKFAQDLCCRHNILTMRSTSPRAQFSRTSTWKLERFINSSTTYMVDYRPYTKQWSHGLDICGLNFEFSVELESGLSLEHLRINLLPFVIASSQTWNDGSVTFILNTPGSEQATVTIALGLLRRRVLKALKAYLEEHGNGNEVCPEIWVNGQGRVIEVILRNVTVRVIGGRRTGGEEDNSAPPPYPSTVQLDSTIHYLAWSIRSWQKAKWAWKHGLGPHLTTHKEHSHRTRKQTKTQTIPYRLDANTYNKPNQSPIVPTTPGCLLMTHTG